MTYVPLVAIPALYVLTAVLRPRLKRTFGRAPCAICTSVAVTWGGLAILRLTGTEVPKEILGILMGMSVAGVMYALEPVYRKRRIRNFWFVRPVVIVAGLYATAFFLADRWDRMSFVLIVGVFAIVIASFLFQGITHEDALSELEGKGKASLISKLEDCC